MQPKALDGVGNLISAAFRQSEPSVHGVQRFGSIPITDQLQGDLLSAADAITTNMTSFVQELDHGGYPFLMILTTNQLVSATTQESPIENGIND